MKNFLNVIKMLFFLGGVALSSQLHSQLNYLALYPKAYKPINNSSFNLNPLLTDPYKVSNAAIDVNGNVVFHVRNDQVYASNGSLVGNLADLYYSTTLPCTTLNVINSEIAIVPKPNSCNRYYIIYSKSCGAQNGVVLGYSEIDCSGSIPVFVPNKNGIVLATSGRNKFGIAVSKITEGNKRYLFCIGEAGSTGGNCLRFSINNNDISNQTLIATNADLNVGSTNFETNELELSPDQTKLVWTNNFGSLNGYVFQINLTSSYTYDGYYIYQGVSNGFQGVEFSANSQRIYVSTSNGLGWYSINNNTYNSISSTTNLNNSYLELATNGDIYCISNTGDLFRISTTTNSVTNANAGYTQLSNSGGRYTLPDQIDGENYNWLFNPIAATISQSGTLCAGSSISLTANTNYPSSNDSYTWSSGQATSQITVSNGGLYSVTITNPNGCSAVTSINVVSNPTPSITLPLSYQICSGTGNGVVLTATLSPSGTPFSWSPTTGLTNSTTLSPTANPTATTTYNLSAYTAAGCSAVASTTVNVVTNCCQGESYQTICNGQLKSVNLTYGDVNMSKIYSDLCGINNIITTTRKIAVNGTLTIDGTYFIENTPNFTMGANAVINNSGGFLIIWKNSELKACGNEMWQGIRMISGGYLYTDNNSLIADAREAVYLENNNLGCYLWNTRFYRNNVSIRMQSLTSPQFEMQGCAIKFDLSDNLTYPLLAPHANKRPEVGVLVGLSSNVVIGTTNGANNVFDGLNCGIHTQFSSFTVNKNIFQNIRRYNGAGSYYGCGINSLSFIPWIITPASATIKTVVGAVTASTPSTFINCDTAIFMSAMNADIDNNKMLNVNYGVIGLNGNNQNFYVKNNRIDNTDFGVTINNSPGCRNRIQNNYITVNNPTPAIPGPARNTYGISQQETNNTVNSNTQIFQNTVYGGRSCVQLNTCRNTLISENFLYQTQGAAVTGNQSCVYNTNCQNVYVNSNSFTGNLAEYDDVPPTSYTSNRRKSGVEFFNSQGVVCSNTANTIGYGFNFVAGCSGTNLRNNVINATKYGTTLKQSGSGGIIGQQGNLASPAGNVFGGPFNNPSAYRTYTFNSFGNQSPFYRVQPTDYPSPNGFIGLGNAITTLPCNSNTTNYSCAIGTYNKTDGEIMYAADALQTEHDVADGNTDAFAEAGFEAGVFWLSQKNLFDRLDKDYDLRNADAALEAFYNANTTSAYGRLKTLDELKSEMLLTAEKDSLSAVAMLADLQSQNSLLNKAVLQEANHQLFNEIYLSTLNTSFKGFAQKQKVALFALANSCPYIDGDAVYRARTLYAQIDNTIFFDNEALCAASKVAYKKENEQLKGENKAFFARFAPNPAQGYTSLIYQIEDGTTATLSLTNQLGQEVLTIPLNGNTNRADISVANLMQGIYFYKVTNHLGEMLSGKLNIFK